jgi:8-oxo-dGTP pyrophosphatase MutT (NUDIX family)
MAPQFQQFAVDEIPVDPAIEISLLTSSREALLEQKKSASGSRYDTLVVGAAIFKNGAHPQDGSGPRLLLLKRADHETFYPGVFEIPGGKVEAQDATVKHAVVREVFEETGLAVKAFLTELVPMPYTTVKQVEGRTTTKQTLQLNYLITCSEDEVKLCAEEHSEYIWAAAGEVDGIKMTDEMRRVVCDAFDRASKLLQDR